jgi:hypothetical protein
MILLACVGDTPTPTGTPTPAGTSMTDAALSSSSGGSVVDAATEAASILDATTEAGSRLDASVDASLPTTTCTEHPLDGVNIRCAAAGPGPLAGGSISVGNYLINRSKGPACLAYIYGTATIYVEAGNLFMRWLRVEDKADANSPGVKRFGTALLRVGSGNKIERVEVCDPSSLGRVESGSFGVNGSGDVQFDFGTHSEGWQKL